MEGCSVLFGLKNKYFDKYYNNVIASYNDNFFNIKRAEELMCIGELTADTKNYLTDFLSAADDDIKKFMYLFYYLQFMSDEDFIFDIWELDTIPMPENWEKRYPGAIKSIVYLFAYDHFKNLIEELSLPKECLSGYFNRYRYFVELNKISHKVCALCRLSPFLYAMATARTLVIGRLSFQLKKLFDYANIYEFTNGTRVFAALPNYSYGSDGLQSKDGILPMFEDLGGKIYAHIFDENGRLSPKPSIIDISEAITIYNPGDLCITVHIPEGRKLAMDLVFNSIKNAWTIFKKMYPDLKCIICQTWFIDPNIRSCLSEGGNLEAFAGLFDVISATDSKLHPLYEHIFKTDKQPVSNLVAKNSFQQRILDHVNKTGRLFWGFGILKKAVFEKVSNEEYDILEK